MFGGQGVDKGVSVVSGQQYSPRQSLSQLGKEWRLEQTSDLIPAGQKFSRSCGEPHSRPTIKGVGVWEKVINLKR